jgi:aquaporin Z
MNLLKTWFTKPTPSILSKVAAEFIACAMFHFIGSVSPTAYTNGIALMVLVYYTAKTSGAHLNPALSLSFMFLGYTNPLELLFYWIAQILGCAFGALWISFLVPGLYIGKQITRFPNRIAYDGCFVPLSTLSDANIFGWEALCTFNFILPIFSVVWYTLHKPGYGTTGPLMVGLSLIANILVAASFTGGALNPARVLGSMIIFKCPSPITSVYYIMGELLGGLIVPVFIIPWYGVNPEAWYFEFNKKSTIIKYVEKHQTSSSIRSPIRFAPTQQLTNTFSLTRTTPIPAYKTPTRPRNSNDSPFIADSNANNAEMPVILEVKSQEKLEDRAVEF